MPMYRKINKNFFKKWTHNMAYVLGFFSAYGYITVNKRGGQFWCIQITDTKLLESIKNVVGLIGGSIYKPKDKDFCRLQFSTSNTLRLYDFMYNGYVQEDGLFLKGKKSIF